MLVKFAVTNYRGFANRIEWDLSKPSNYSFNTFAIKDGIIKNGIVYGPNGSGMIKFDGKVTIKADNGVKYRCLRLAYMEYEDRKYKRIVDFYVTDDENHIPIRLDMFLKFGAAKAFLVGMKGVRNPVSSIVK